MAVQLLNYTIISEPDAQTECTIALDIYNLDPYTDPNFKVSTVNDIFEIGGDALVALSSPLYIIWVKTHCYEAETYADILLDETDNGALLAFSVNRLREYMGNYKGRADLVELLSYLKADHPIMFDDL